MIDYDGNARLSLAAHDTSGISHARPWSVEDTKDCSYMAPETWSPSKPTTPDAIMGTSPTVGGGSATMESDIYEMAIVVHKARSYRSISPGVRVKSHNSFLDLDGDSTALRVSRIPFVVFRDRRGSCAGARRD